MSVWHAGSCPRQPLLVVAGRGLRTAVGVLRSGPPATEFIWPLPLHFIHHHILQDIRMCGFHPSEIPKALSLIGVIVERTTAAQQNMSSLQEEELKKGQIVP